MGRRLGRIQYQRRSPLRSGKLLGVLEQAPAKPALLILWLHRKLAERSGAGNRRLFWNRRMFRPTVGDCADYFTVVLGDEGRAEPDPTGRGGGILMRGQECQPAFSERLVRPVEQIGELVQ